MDDAALSIGGLAERAGIATSAIRFYERRGLITPTERVSGRRRYDDDAVRRLEVIAVAKQAGFSLDEIAVLLESTDAGAPADAALRELAARRLPDVEALIAQAETMRTWLLHAAACECADLDGCALFTAAPEGGKLPMVSGC